MSEVTAEQVIEAARKKHPEADELGPILHWDSPPRNHYWLIPCKRVRRWILWPVWSKECIERLGTYSAPSLPALLAKIQEQKDA